MDINILRRHAYRNTLWTFFVILFFVIGIFTGKAFANEPEQIAFLDQKPEQYLRAKPASTTTTTTVVVQVPRPVVQQVPTAAAQPVTSVQVNPDHTILMGQAGIPEADWSYVELLVAKESGWNPAAVNKSSGACGLPQALPCSKLGVGLDDPVGQLRWMNSYVIARYTSWANAWSHSKTRGWY